MKRIILILFWILSLNSFGQNLTSNIVLTSDSDTTFWLDYQLNNIQKLKLINPESDTDFLRVSTSKYFLELSPGSNKIIFYAQEIWDNVQPGESFIKHYYLTNEQANGIRRFFKNLQIYEIPSDKFIQNWLQGLDGIEYIIELKKGNSYSFKNYWTPSAQDIFDESKRILEFTRQLDKIVDYPAKRKEFEKEIPFYSWTYNGFIAVTKVTSYREYRKYKRTKKRQQKDKINISHKDKANE